MFKDHLPCEVKAYINHMLENRKWGGETELFVFYDVYISSVDVFDATTRTIPYLITENNIYSHSVYLLLAGNSHFDCFVILKSMVENGLMNIQI